jgi:hypothetical protein
VSVERLTFHAIISGSIHDAKAPQKIRATIGPAEKGNGRNYMTQLAYSL